MSAAVVVLGSLHYDIMIDAPHRPRRGETVAGSRWYPKFGGKGGNQAVALRRCGSDTRLVAAVGQDSFGRYLLDAIDAADLSRRHVSIDTTAATGMSVAIVDNSGDYGAVIVSGVNLLIDAVVLDDVALWAGASLLLLQNEVSPELNLAAALRARETGVRVCLNAAPARALERRLEEHVDILVVNALEAEALCGVPVASLDDAAAACERLAARFPTVVVTAGEHGVAAAAPGLDTIRLPAVAIEVVGTHGAGDVFTGALCASLAAGGTLAAAVATANGQAARHVAGR